MPHSTIKAFRRYAQVHDIELCVVAKKAVTEFCLMTPSPNDIMDKKAEPSDRMFISMPDTAMRCLDLWSANTGIAKPKLMEWAIRKLAKEQKELEEEENT